MTSLAQQTEEDSPARLARAQPTRSQDTLELSARPAVSGLTTALAASCPLYKRGLLSLPCRDLRVPRQGGRTPAAVLW